MVLICLLAIFWRGGRPREPSATVSVGDPSEPRRLSAISKNLDPGVLSRKVKIEPGDPEERESDPYEEWSTEKILAHFGVPPGKFDGASLQEVVAYLEQVFEENGGRGIGFRIEGSGGHPITCEFGNVSVQSLMDLVSGLGGYDVSAADGEVVFRRKLPAAAAGVQTVRLEAGIWQRLAGIDSSADAEIAGDAWIGIAEALQAEYGIGFGSGSEAGVDLDPETGQVLVTNSLEESHRLLAIHQFLGEGPGTLQVQVSSKGVSVGADPTELPAVTYSEPEYQTEIRRLSQASGVSLISIPGVVTRGGQAARVMTGREVVYPTGWDGGEPTQFETKITGFSMDVVTTVLGLDRVELVGKLDHTLVGEQNLNEFIGGGYKSKVEGTVNGEKDFHTHLTEFEGLIQDGNTAGFIAAEDDGSGVQQFITVRRILSDGTPLLPGAPVR